MDSINERIQALWEMERDRGIGDGLGCTSKIDDIEEECTEHARRLLQPLLRVFEEQLLWLSLLNKVLHPRRFNTETDKSPSVVWSYFGAATAYASALRRCILCGHEPASKIILRSYIETLEVGMLLFFYEDLRREFHEAGLGEDPERAEYELWSRRVGYGNLRKLLAKLDADLGIDVAWGEDVRAWRKMEKAYLSASVHPTSSAALWSTYAPSLVIPGSFGLAIHGHISEEAVRSLNAAVQCSWLVTQYLCSPSVRNVPQSVQPLLVLDRDKPDDMKILYGAVVFTELQEAGYMDPRPLLMISDPSIDRAPSDES